MRRGGLLLTGAALALLGAGVAAMSLRWALSPADPQGAEVVFTVAPGESLCAIARNLEHEKLVRSARAVEWIGRLRGLDGSLRRGEYSLSAAQSPGEILSHLASGDIVNYPVVLPEGFTAAQIGARLAAAGLVDETAFAAAVHDPALIASLGIEADSLEGYLFPETYLLPKGLSRRRGGPHPGAALPARLARARAAGGRAGPLAARGGDAGVDRREGNGRARRSGRWWRRSSATVCGAGCGSNPIRR